MMRSVLLGSVAIAATLGGHFASGMLSSPQRSGDAPQEQIDVVKLEPISVPVIRDGKVVGYVIARLSVLAPSADAKTHKELIAAYAGEGVFRGIYEEKSFDFSEMRAADVSELGRRIVEIANKKLGKPILREAAIESINFVSQAELQARRKN